MSNPIDFLVKRGSPIDVVFELAGVLDVLDAQEAHAAEQSDEEQKVHQFDLATLSCRDRPSHSER